MTVAFRAGATANNNQSGNTASASVTIPASAQIGDTALFCMVQNSGTATFTPPAGWVLKRPTGSTGNADTINANLRTTIWAKDIASGEPGTSVTFNSNVGARLPGVMSVFSGTSAASIFVEMNPVATADSTAPYTVTAPSINTQVDNTGIAAFWVLRDPTGNPAPDLTVPSAHTADSVSKTAFAASPNFTVQASHRTTPGAAGPYGGTTATATEPVTAVVYYVALPPTSTPPPVASFTATPTSGDAPLSVTFTDTSTGTPTSWAWNFGDGTTATTQNPSHTYVTSGSYTVSMTATNAGGSDAASTATVTAAEPVSGGGLHLFMLDAGGSWVSLTPHALI